MTSFGYALSSEEHSPRALVELAVRAEDLGFDFCSISDHYHPWVEAQGHSPFVWSVLGAIAATTTDIGVAIGVTCPLVRLHPAVVAQAAATTSLLLEDRFSFGVGTGEASERTHPRAPVAATRSAIGDARRGGAHHAAALGRGRRSITMARSTPSRTRDSSIHPSTRSNSSCRASGRPRPSSPDGSVMAISVTAPIRDLSRSTSRPAEADRSLRSCMYAWEATNSNVAKPCMRYGPTPPCRASSRQELPTWTHFEQVAELVTEDDVADRVPCGPASEPIVERVRAMVEAGYDHIYLHQIGPDQDAFFALWEAELEDGLREMS